MNDRAAMPGEGPPAEGFCEACFGPKALCVLTPNGRHVSELDTTISRLEAMVRHPAGAAL